MPQLSDLYSSERRILNAGANYVLYKSSDEDILPSLALVKTEQFTTRPITTPLNHVVENLGNRLLTKIQTQSFPTCRIWVGNSGVEVKSSGIEPLKVRLETISNVLPSNVSWLLIQSRAVVNRHYTKVLDGIFIAILLDSELSTHDSEIVNKIVPECCIAAAIERGSPRFISLNTSRLEAPSSSPFLQRNRSAQFPSDNIGSTFYNNSVVRILSCKGIEFQHDSQLNQLRRVCTIFDGFVTLDFSEMINMKGMSCRPTSTLLASGELITRFNNVCRGILSGPVADELVDMISFPNGQYKIIGISSGQLKALQSNLKVWLKGKRIGYLDSVAEEILKKGESESFDEYEASRQSPEKFDLVSGNKSESDGAGGIVPAVVGFLKQDTGFVSVWIASHGEPRSVNLEKLMSSTCGVVKTADCEWKCLMSKYNLLHVGGRCYADPATYPVDPQGMVSHCLSVLEKNRYLSLANGIELRARNWNPINESKDVLQKVLGEDTASKIIDVDNSICQLNDEDILEEASGQKIGQSVVFKNDSLRRYLQYALSTMSLSHSIDRSLLYPPAYILCGLGCKASVPRFRFILEKVNIRQCKDRKEALPSSGDVFKTALMKALGMNSKIKVPSESDDRILRSVRSKITLCNKKRSERSCSSSAKANAEEALGLCSGTGFIHSNSPTSFILSYSSMFFAAPKIEQPPSTIELHQILSSTRSS